MAEAESKLFKPIVGCEMYVARRTMDKKEGKPDQSGYHLIVLAKNEKGYHNLINLYRMPGQGDTICVRVQTAVNWKSIMRG